MVNGVLMVKGDLDNFELEDGSEVRVPKNFGLVHDPTGKLLDRCTCYVVRYRIDMHSDVLVPRNIKQFVSEYYGDDARLVRAFVEVPDVRWQFVGVVKRIAYVRHGDRTVGDEHVEGDWWHPFSDSDPKVELYRSPCSKHDLMLQMPDGCILNDLGFVFP